MVLAGSIKVITEHCFTHNIKALHLLISDFFNFPIVILWELMTPVCSQFGPKGHEWQDLCRVPLLNMQASSLVVSEMTIFLCFPIISLWKVMSSPRRGLRLR